MHRPNGSADRGDSVEICLFNTPVGQISLNFIVLTKSKRYSIKSSKTDLFQTYAYHNITTVCKPILSAKKKSERPHSNILLTINILQTNAYHNITTVRKPILLVSR